MVGAPSFSTPVGCPFPASAPTFDPSSMAGGERLPSLRLGRPGRRGQRSGWFCELLERRSRPFRVPQAQAPFVSGPPCEATSWNAGEPGSNAGAGLAPLSRSAFRSRSRRSSWVQRIPPSAGAWPFRPSTPPRSARRRFRGSWPSSSSCSWWCYGGVGRLLPLPALRGR